MSSANVLRNFCVLSVVALASCGGQAPDAGDKDATTVIVAPEQQGTVKFDALTPTSVQGTYEYHGVTVRFEANASDTARDVTLEVRGMTLTGTFDPAGGVFDLDGFTTQTGADTQMTEVDTTVIHTFEIALADLYQREGDKLPALDVLNRAITIWGDYTPTAPLRRMFYGRQERLTLQSLCGAVNRPGQGNAFFPRWSWGSHDCLTVKSLFGDCAAITAGCQYGDDSSTVEHGFLSMHPGGSCSDNTYFGTTTANFACYEPDHDANVEFSYGDCLGRCGGGCGGGTVFSQACLDHDICVRFGHVLAAGDCDDELLDAAFDAAAGTNCSDVNFRVDFNWAGSSVEGNCPSSWNYSNDGCDVGCQFVDGDCFR